MPTEATTRQLVVAESAVEVVAGVRRWRVDIMAEAMRAT
jgi:hypothetical protein